MKVIMAYQAAYPFHYHYTGSVKYVYYLSKYLVKYGLDVEIVTSLNSGKKRTEIYDGIKYTLLPPSTDRRVTALWCLLFSINLARYLKKKRFDILHGYEVVPYAYLHLRNRAPVVYQPFGNEGLTISHTRPLAKIYEQILVKPFWRYCGANADVIAAEGDFQLNAMMKLYSVSREKVFILPVGIDSSFIMERLKVSTISRDQLGLADNDFVLISINTLNAVNGINHLVDAFYFVKQKLANARLIIIGTGMEEERITSQIKKYGLMDSIIHLKNISENLLYDYYALSDLYVSPTLLPDFIMGILEAEACGLPIVSTGQDWLIKEGTNGYVVPQKDPVAMAEAVFKIYSGELKSMGLASREISRDYDFKTIAKKAIELYQKLVR